MKVTKSNAVKTVLIISVGFGFIFLLFDFKWTLYTSLSIGVLGIISNRAAQTIDFVWMKLAEILSFIVPNILLSTVFYLFLFPISVLSKIFGNKDSLQLKNKKKSIWIDKTQHVEKISFEKMW